MVMVSLGRTPIPSNIRDTDSARSSERRRLYSEEPRVSAKPDRVTDTPSGAENAEPFRTNARDNQTFDQIGLFFRERGLPTHLDNKDMGTNEIGPDYGVFNFVNLFQDALGQSREELYPRFEHKVSDHLPLWLRLPLPKD